MKALSSISLLIVMLISDVAGMAAGTFYLPDRSKLNINFTYGSPEGRGKLTDSGGQLWMVEYDGKVPMPMSQMPEPSSKVIMLVHLFFV
jgi:hypothetical protein